MKRVPRQPARDFVIDYDLMNYIHDTVKSAFGDAVQDAVDKELLLMVNGEGFKKRIEALIDARLHSFVEGITIRTNGAGPGRGHKGRSHRKISLSLPETHCTSGHGNLKGSSVVMLPTLWNSTCGCNKKGRKDYPNRYVCFPPTGRSRGKHKCVDIAGQCPIESRLWLLANQHQKNQSMNPRWDLLLCERCSAYRIYASVPSRGEGRRVSHSPRRPHLILGNSSPQHDTGNQREIVRLLSQGQGSIFNPGRQIPFTPRHLHSAGENRQGHENHEPASVKDEDRPG